jgi:rhodanese-related sulfurtransferase
MMKQTQDTLGNQKMVNYALNQPNKSAFTAAVLDGLTPPPAYFSANVLMNKQGYESIDEVLKNGTLALTPSDFERIADVSGALILDTRSPHDFSLAFIPNSINIGIQGDFAPWVGALVGDVRQEILLVCDQDMEVEVTTRLARVGFDSVIGYLQGGISAWMKAGKEVDRVDRVSADRLSKKEQDAIIIDIRRPSEYDEEHILGAINRPLDQINTWSNDLDRDKHYFIHCAGGYRSMIASSILQSRGIRNFSEVEGGYRALKEVEEIKTLKS